MLGKQKSARGPSTLARTIVQGTRHVYRTETDVVFSTPFERRPLPTRPTERSPRSDPATGA